MPLLAMGQTEGEILRIKIEWLNAEECGIEGCKPQSLVIRSGGSMTFGWPQIPERGMFEVRPVVAEDAIHMSLKGMKMIEGRKPEVVFSEDLTFKLGRPQDVSVQDLKWMVTITKEASKEQK